MGVQGTIRDSVFCLRKSPIAGGTCAAGRTRMERTALGSPTLWMRTIASIRSVDHDRTQDLGAAIYHILA